MSPPCTAILARMVDARALSPDARADAQRELRVAFDLLHDRLGDRVLSRFVMPIGDAFQGLLADPSALPEVQWEVALHVPEVAFRWGIGHGTLITPWQPDALGMDGPAWQHARDALDAAAGRGVGSTVFRGFDDDDVLGGVAHLLEHHRARLSDVQIETLDCLRQGHTQQEAARLRGVSPQSVSATLAAAGATAYLHGEAALIALLARHDRREAWREERT